MDYELLASTCVDGDCPSIHKDRETGDFVLRSRSATDPNVELDIRYTPAEFESLLQQIGR